MYNGSCLCGAVTFKVTGDLGAPVACHCTQCRKQSGHYWAAADVERTGITIKGEMHLKHYSASKGIRRSFCGACGSFLFWEILESSTISIATGAFDGPITATLSKHIFVSDKGDYYDIADGLPQEG
jgi:hypothetical protein